jgi:hypothetical protein
VYTLVILQTFTRHRIYSGRPTCKSDDCLRAYVPARSLLAMMMAKDVIALQIMVDGDRAVTLLVKRDSEISSQSQ